MPELPEVETMRRGILPAIQGEIAGAVLPKNRYRPLSISPAFAQLRKQIVGTTILDVQRLGKRVLMVLSSDRFLVFQPKMAGLLLVGEPPTSEHVRIRLQIKRSPIQEILYWDKRGLGSIHLWSAEQVEEHLGPSHLGPDALAVDWQQFRDRFADCTRPIKPTLLDQKRLAGIGNLYASEILHKARISPTRPCAQLNTTEWKRVHEATWSILHQAIEYEGSTLSDGSYRNAHSAPGAYQNEHQVYDRAGELCLRCQRSRIVRTVQAQRSTFYCPICQAK